jgi:putative spermidine/putrescine transport system permease protein
MFPWISHLHICIILEREIMDIHVPQSIEPLPETLAPAQDKPQKAEMRRGYAAISWLGVIPFLLFCLLFEILPTLIILQGSLVDDQQAFTLNNYQRLLTQSSTLHAFGTSIELSLITAVISGLIGPFAAYGLSTLPIPWVRNFLTSFSSVVANFTGVPLAYAFISTLGVTGFVTVLLKNVFHFSLYDLGFNLYSFWGLVLIYVYFELPLMILITVPALSALHSEWQEAATSLGASQFQYWRKVAFPILLPSLVAAMMLLFANAFGAYATAYALGQGNINLITILISFVVAGNVTIDVGLGNALAVGMILVLGIAISLYLFMLRRASIWQKR